MNLELNLFYDNNSHVSFFSDNMKKFIINKIV